MSGVGEVYCPARAEAQGRSMSGVWGRSVEAARFAGLRSTLRVSLRVSGVDGRQWLRINGVEGPLVLSSSKYERGVGEVR